MAQIGVDALGIVLIMAVTSGSVFALYTASLASNIGFVDVVGGTLAYAFLNELGPVLGGIAFAARSGAAIAAEIGTMAVTEQVDALRAMAVSPVRYLVAPRVLAATLMLPLLIVIADFIGVGAGLLSSSANGIPPATFLASVYKFAHARDLTNGMIKALFFGFIIGTVACQTGLSTRGGATGVGRSTTRSVVLCVMLITIADVFLANILRQIK
jgi:phospholipid/cholesterol/gamma-HCH transport system permease protein